MSRPPLPAELAQRCLDLQGLYAETLAELGHEQPDLDRLALLAAQATALLRALPAPALLAELAPAPRAELLAATAQANELLKRVAAMLAHRRDRLVAEQARNEQAAGAARAYRTGTTPEPRFLDQRR
jgi:hypothetical protein